MSLYWPRNSSECDDFFALKDEGREYLNHSNSYVITILGSKTWDIFSLEVKFEESLHCLIRA